MIKPQCASLRWRLSTSVFFGLLVLLIAAPGVQAQWTTNGNNINNTNTGNVGVGTTTPAVKLAVNGSGTNVYNTDVWVENNIHVQGNETLTQGGRGRLRIGTAWGYMGLYSDASSTSVQNDLVLGAGSGNVRVGPGVGGVIQNLIVPSGNIGLGTTAPGGLVDFASTTQINNRLLLSGQEFFAAGNTSTSGIALRLGTNRTGERQLWIADSAQAINSTNAQLRMRFFSNLASLDALTTDGTDVRPLILQSVGGNVGIGTTTPSAKLHVIGDVAVSGNIAAKYQDVAEWVPAAHALPPGTVVTLSSTQSNLVEASAKAYDTRVAGVISEQPGITLGERAGNKVLVATTGRVKVKVDATKTPIGLGDLLVTSEKEGVAMKSEPIDVGGVKIHRPGTIIGKALESLAKGQGEILVLLSLQ